MNQSLLPIVAILILLRINNIYGTGFLYISSPILMQPGASFMNYIYFNTSKTTVTKCSVSYIDPVTNMTINVPIEIGKYKRETINHVQSIKNRISPLLRDKCGFKFDKFQEEDPQNFILHFEYDENGKKMVDNKTFNVNIFDNIHEDKNETILVEFGQEIVFECGIKSPKSCTLYDPSGNEVFRGKSCKYNIKYVSMVHIGTWMCQWAVLQNMVDGVQHITFKLVEPSRMITWYKEELNFGNIGCHYSYKSKATNNLPLPDLQFCQLISPDGSIYTISVYGGATTRYTTIGTNLTDYTCQLEFPLPIKSKEIGPWKCFLDKFGGYVNTNGTYISEETKSDINLFAPLKLPLDVICTVPYTTDDCYMIGPDRKFYTGGTIDDFSVGRCITKLSEVKESDFGVWTCHFSKPNMAVDDLITVNVLPFNDFKSITAHVEVDEGDAVLLLCKTHSAIINCVFEDPKGQTYHVSPTKNSTIFKYHGNGFNYGDCGLVIERINVDQAGEWTCFTRFNVLDAKLSKESVSARIEVVVNEKGPSMATTIGLSVGAGLVIIAIVVSLYISKFRKKQVTNNDPDAIPLNTVPHNIEINSSTSIAHL